MAQEMTTLDLATVRGWCERAFKRSPQPSDAACMSIAIGIENIARHPVQNREPQPEFSATRYARLLRRHLPELIAYWKQAAERDDENSRVPGSSYGHYRVSELEELSEHLTKSYALNPKRPKQYVEWNLQAAAIESIINRARHHYDNSKPLSRGIDCPLIWLVSSALMHIGQGEHSPGAIRDALKLVPLRARPTIHYRTVSASGPAGVSVMISPLPNIVRLSSDAAPSSPPRAARRGATRRRTKGDPPD